MPGFFPGLASNLGLASDFQANPYKTDPNAYQWNGPSQGELYGYQQGAQGQSANDYAQQQGVNAQQSAYAQMLQNAAMGNGPSAAQGLLQQGADRAAAQSISLARSGGGNPAQQAAAMRAAMQQGAGAMTSAGAQAAQLKAQEQQAAMGMMGNALGQQRSQDLASMGQGNAMTNAYLGDAMQQSQAQLDANMQQQQLNSQNYNAAQNINAGVAANQAAAGGQIFGAGVEGLEGVATGGASLSDARVKFDVRPEGFGEVASTLDRGHPSEGTKSVSLADAFLDSLRPASYRYNAAADEPRTAPNGGRYLGVMAQDIERGPGAQAVRDTPRGKVVEVAPMMQSLAAGVGRLHERLAQLEAERKGRR